jgi:hypothetical protein
MFSTPTLIGRIVLFAVFFAPAFVICGVAFDVRLASVCCRQVALRGALHASVVRSATLLPLLRCQRLSAHWTLPVPAAGAILMAWGGWCKMSPTIISDHPHHRLDAAHWIDCILAMLPPSWIGGRRRAGKRTGLAGRRPDQGRQTDPEQVVASDALRSGVQAGIRTPGPVHTPQGWHQRVRGSVLSASGAGCGKDA